MKELLHVRVDADKNVSVSTDYEFLESATRFDRSETLYQRLVSALRGCSRDCLAAIRMLEQARKDARFDYKDLHPELTEALVAWRRAKARELQAPVFMILHQRVLYAIADKMPVSEDELLAIPGFGPGLFARHGQEILQLTRKLQQGDAVPADSDQEPA